MVLSFEAYTMTLYDQIKLHFSLVLVPLYWLEDKQQLLHVPVWLL